MTTYLTVSFFFCCSLTWTPAWPTYSWITSRYDGSWDGWIRRKIWRENGNVSFFERLLLWGMRRGGNECFYLTFLLITMNFGGKELWELWEFSELEKRYSNGGRNCETWKFFTSISLLRWGIFETYFRFFVAKLEQSRRWSGMRIKMWKMSVKRLFESDLSLLSAEWENENVYNIYRKSDK